MRRLEWGNARHEAALLKEFAGFDLVVGADVVYVKEALPPLLASSAALLRREPWVRSHIPFLSSRGTVSGVCILLSGIPELSTSRMWKPAAAIYSIESASLGQMGVCKSSIADTSNATIAFVP